MMEGEEDEEREIWCSKIDWKGGGQEEVVGIYTVQAVILCV